MKPGQFARTTPRITDPLMIEVIRHILVRAGVNTNRKDFRNVFISMSTTDFEDAVALTDLFRFEQKELFTICADQFPKLNIHQDSCLEEGWASVGVWDSYGRYHKKADLKLINTMHCRLELADRVMARKAGGCAS